LCGFLFFNIKELYQTKFILLSVIAGIIYLNTNTVFTKNAYSLPFWRRPIALLALMVFGMHMGFATWMALLNNFVHERANFDG